MFYTCIVAIDNKVIMVPNGKMADSSIVNYSVKQKRRLDMFFDVDYNSNIDIVKQAIIDALNNCSFYNGSVSPFVNVEEYKESCVRMVLKVWCDNSDYWSLYYFLQEEVKKQFEQQHIEVPYITIRINN